MEAAEERLLEASRTQTREQLLPLIERGQEAEILLGSKVLAAWWEDFQARSYELLDEVPLNDTVSRDRIYLTLGIVRKMKRDLKHYVEEGTAAKEGLSQFLELEKKGLLGRIFDV